MSQEGFLDGKVLLYPASAAIFLVGWAAGLKCHFGWQKDGGQGKGEEKSFYFQK